MNLDKNRSLSSERKHINDGSKVIIYKLCIELSLLHTGSFAQNSFQIDSINSCSTSKKLQFWLKIVKIIYLLTLKPIKGKLGFILEIMKKIARWRHKSEISKRNVKTMISPLLFCLLGWLGFQKKQFDPLKFI